jgi:membrane-anchored protein YejM (alkaline phosphatase superfamily)
VKVKIGDIYIRNSNKKIWKVRKIDNTMVVLESEDGTHLTLTDMFGLEKAYSKKESQPT